MRAIVGLFIPADLGQPCRFVIVEESAAAISDALGGVLVEELLVAGGFAGMWTVYGAEYGVGLPDNRRAGVLSARAGYDGRDVLRRMAGDVLILGLDASGQRDQDVPLPVLGLLDAAWIAVR